MKQSEHYLQPYYFSMESAACMSAIGTFLRDKLQCEWRFFHKLTGKRVVLLIEMMFVLILNAETHFKRVRNIPVRYRSM